MKPFERMLFAFLLSIAVFFGGCDKSSNRPAAETKDRAGQKESIIVHTTRTGKKYHRAGCQYLSRSDIPVDLEEAKARGLEPCLRCRPPR